MTRKRDEIALWQAFGAGTSYRTPREAGRALGMPRRRVDYLCEKWARQGIYDYGVACDLGWKGDVSVPELDASDNRRELVAPPIELHNASPSHWTYTVAATEPSILGRYQVYLTVENFMRYGGNDGWGWGAWTLAGARRKGARELARYRRRQEILVRRQRLIERGVHG